MTVWWPPSIEAAADETGSVRAVALPAGRRISGRLRPPSSKSLTHRALALALLSRRPTVVARPLAAEDTALFLAALRTLGHRCDETGDAIAILPPAHPATAGDLHCGNAGTMFRFLVAIAATLPGRFRIDGVARLRERPIRPLTEALRQLGVVIDFEGEEGHAPLVVHGGRLPGGRVRLDASASSQYLSALLLAGQRAESAIEIEVPQLASAPYVALTLEMIERFGGRVEAAGPTLWRSQPSALRATEVEIEADFSAAAYPAAAAVLSRGEVRIEGVARSSRQGDRRLFDLLTAMGAVVAWSDGGASVSGGAELRALEADLGDIPDQVPTIAALAPFARGTTRIRNVAHLRVKESDRLAAMTSELRRVGATVEELADGLVIEGIWAEREPPAFPVLVDPHGDHRIAMAMALVGLRRPSLRIAEPACVGKSYPDFWRDFARLLGAIDGLTGLTAAAERLDHPTFAPAAGRALDASACTDRAKLAALLQGAAALSLCDSAGWSLAAGWAGAGVDDSGRLSGLVAQPGRTPRTAQEQLRELLLRLFRAEHRVTGRGEGRSAARQLLQAWEGALAPMSADEAIGRIFAAAEFLWEPEFAPVRLGLRGVLVREGVEIPWLAGPAAVRQRLAGTPRPEEVPGPGPETLREAETLFARGRFEQASLMLAGRDDVAALAMRGACFLLLGELPAAREIVHALAARPLTAAERIASGDLALRVLALSGEADAASDWAAAALARARSSTARALAHLLGATAALDRGDRAAAEKHLDSASGEAANPTVFRAWHETRVWQALAASDGEGAVAHSRALLGARRRMRRFEAGRAWNNLGLGYLTLGDFARAERAFQHSARLLRLCDGPLAITLAQWNLAEVRLRTGKLLDVEPILRASMAHNRKSGNRRGLTVDEALWVRLELVRGRPDAAVERCIAWLAEQTRLGQSYYLPQLAVLAARALGWMERPGEAADWLESVDAAGLGELEAEELPALFALAGRLDEARQRARAGAFAALWLPALAGDPPPADAFPAHPSCAHEEPGACAAALAALPAFRRARLLLDLELTLPGAVPRAHREAAAELFRRLGAPRYAAILARGEAGQWTALRAYLGCSAGDRTALAELFRAVGAPEAELVWSSPAGDRRWLEGSPPESGGEELLAEGSGGTLRLRAARIDEVLRAVFALLLREVGEHRLEPLQVASCSPGGEVRAVVVGGGLVGDSPLLAVALDRLRQFAASDMPVLILGESGSGKELAAREVRRASARSGAPWVPVNCAALSETLLLSDLFGHARGAFTGADRARAGVFETAHGGTVFLDEIGDLPPAAQGNLLRVLQEGEVRRLGESTARRVDVRLVAATHRDLAGMVRDGKFRQDLYYRLKVCTVTLPPLRERGADLMLLAEHFVAAEGRRRALPQLHLAADARRVIAAHRWPGNVRELGNALQAAAALAGNGAIRASMLDLGAPVGPQTATEASAYHREIDDFRRALLRKALRASGGNRAEAARRLGLSRQALSYLVLNLGLEDGDGFGREEAGRGEVWGEGRGERD